jgi:hypothetical protein
MSTSSRIVPRLASSRTSGKWTILPADFTLKVQKVFAEQFQTQSTQGEFVVEGRVYPEEVIIRVGYLENGRLKQVNFEASMDIPKLETDANDVKGAAQSSLERMYVCIDMIGSAFEEFFQVGVVDEMDISNLWQEFDFEGDTVFMQTSNVNSRLEDEADRILGLDGEDLVHIESESDDAMAKAEIDSELALEVQRMIREGKHPLQTEMGTSESEEASRETSESTH